MDDSETNPKSEDDELTGGEEGEDTLLDDDIEDEEEDEYTDEDDEETETTGQSGDTEPGTKEKEGSAQDVSEGTAEKTKRRKKKPKKKLSMLKKALSSIIIESPSYTEVELDTSGLPPSYKAEVDDILKSSQLHGIIQKALRDFRDFYFDRMPLFITVANECNKQRSVMNTINPTQMRFKDLINWQDIAEFVAGYLNYRPLRPPYILPEKQFAPQTVLELKRGHCFEYSTVLCSMLKGAGYDAYVVSGYATREVCELDLKYTKCPVLEEDHNAYPKPFTMKSCRYTVKPPRALVSEFLVRMEKKEATARKVIANDLLQKENKERDLQEAPPHDRQGGWRIHSWVLVLPGRRDVRKCFFIEPTTGFVHPTHWDQYLGIESVWNDLNYYINVHREVVNTRVPVTKQIVPAPFLYPLKRMDFDLGNSCNWDYVFHWSDLHREKTPEELKDEELQGALEERFFDFKSFSSWTKKLKIPRDDYYLKFPTGKKTIRYKKCIQEKYAEYLQPDGLVQKIWAYHDIECKRLHYSKEDFLNRVDQLKTRYFEQDTGKIIEYFNVGRPDFMKEHHFFAQTPGPCTDRKIVFWKNRIDELCRKEEGPDFIRLYYGEAKDDRKYFKEVKFGPKGFIREKMTFLNNLPDPRPIEAITECFRRNPSVPADEDIHRVFFSTIEDDITIEYHVADDKMVGSTRHFAKPTNWWDLSQILTWSPELHHSFEVDPYSRPKTELSLFIELLKQMFKEATTRDETRVSEKETIKILKERHLEEDKVKLLQYYYLAHFDSAKRKARLDEKARVKAARWLSKQDILRDYLEPNIRRYGLEVITTKKQAMKVRDDCLTDLKDRLINQTKIMKEDFEKEKAKIVTMQLWYHEHFIRLNREEEEQYRADIMKNMFVAHIIEQRINTHKEYAPIKYQLLADTIARDERMEQFLV